MIDALRYAAYIAVALAAVTMFLLAPSRCGHEKAETKHDTVVVRDTVVKPVTCTVSTRQVDTVLVSELVTTVVHDTVFVYVPITQSHYHYPDTADIWVSGYRAKVDSASFHFTTSVIRETVEAPAREKPLKFCLEAGIDAVLCDKRLVPDIYLDAGLTIRQKVRFKVGVGTGYDGGVKAFMHGSVSYIIR